MRPRTPSFIWIPFVFSIGGISWVLLVVSLGLLSALMVTPAIKEMRKAEAERNNLAATVALLDQQIELQKKFVGDVNHPMVLMRLAERQFNVTPHGQQILPIDADALHRDRSVDSMLHESLVPVNPAAVAQLPWGLELAARKELRPVLLCVALAGMVAAFLLGVRYERLG